MPNWCLNNVAIKGPISKISAIWKVIKGADNDNGFLNQLVPMPDNEKENWYDWRRANWGTKWDIDASELDYNEDNENGTATIIGPFESAWSPPIQAYDTFLKENEDCTIRADYLEEAMDFGGIYNNGEDMYADNIYENKMGVISFIKKLEETEEVFQDIAERFDLILNHIEWLYGEDSTIDLINERRAKENFPPLTEEEWEDMCEEYTGYSLRDTTNSDDEEEEDEEEEKK
jgi:hypothetical protein